MADIRKYRKTLIIGITAIVIAVAAFLYIAASPKDEARNYKFVKIERGNIESIVSSTGVLNPVVTVQVGSQVSGTLAKIFTDYNQKVKKGELVALIDTTFLAASVRDAQSSLEKAQAQYAQSQRDLTRVKAMVEKNLAAQTDLETAQYNTDVARASLRSAQAGLDRAKINLKYAKITAPIDGTVIARNVDVGQTVAASLSAPTLFLIANDLSKMQIIANVDESDIGQIQEGQSVTFTVQAYPEKTFEGIVQQIRLQPTTIQNVVNYSVVINVNNFNGLLLPGMTATIQFNIAQADNVLKIANAALRFRPTPEMLAEAKTNMQNKLKGQKDSSGEFASRPGENHRQQQGNETNGQTNNLLNGSYYGPSSAGGIQQNGNKTRRNSGQLFYIDQNGKLAIKRVSIGLTDGQYTEIKSNSIQEGLEVISGILSSDQKPTSGSPLQTQPAPGMGGGRRGL
ncbi:MAG: efflux RND transporter periplasmic adaptor subunit [Bacteroidota bacterium]|nr:efflux RND transporter periplasmic adaptor subunit [Bacteroidota bacterium]